jgi:hypothetical protein
MDAFYTSVSSIVILFAKNDMVKKTMYPIKKLNILVTLIILKFKRRTLNDKSGLDLQELVEAVNNTNSQKSFEDRSSVINYISNSFDHYVNSINPRKMTNSSKDIEGYIKEEHIRKRKIISNNEVKRAHSEKDEFSSGENDDGSDSDEYKKEDLHEIKKSKFKSITSAMSRFGKIICVTKGKRFGNYLLALFVFVKLLYTLNSLMQLFVLNHFLGNDYLLLGVEVFGKIWYGDDWTQLKRFPRVTMCDFRIREVGIVHRYTVKEKFLYIFCYFLGKNIFNLSLNRYNVF